MNIAKKDFTSLVSNVSYRVFCVSTFSAFPWGDVVESPIHYYIRIHGLVGLEPCYS